jgi:hypothetical protein
MAQDEPRLVPYTPEPELVPHTNGSHTRRRGRLFPGLTFGFLLGSLLASSLVPRLQWLNLATIGSWQRPVIAAAAAGMLVGVFRRDEPRAIVVTGAIAGLLSLWGVYAIVRLSVHVLFVDRSITRVVTADLVRLLAYGAPGGAVGAAAGWGARTGIELLKTSRSAR